MGAVWRWRRPAARSTIAVLVLAAAFGVGAQGMAAGAAEAPFAAQSVPSGTGFLYAVSCPTRSACYVAGQTATTAGSHVGLVLSLVAGEWRVTRLPAVSLLSGISCVDATHCAATGVTGKGGGVVLATADGRTWTQPEQPPALAGLAAASESWWSVSCVPGRCMAAGSVSSLGTGAGTATALWVAPAPGAAWSAAATPAASSGSPWLEAVSCDRADDCWVVGSSIWRSADGGASWTTLLSGGFILGASGAAPGGAGIGGMGVLPDAVSFADPRHGMVGTAGQCGGVNVVACPGAIFTTSDGGATWQEVTAPGTLAVDALACPPGGQDCVATSWASANAANGLILTTRDGGAHWSREGTFTSLIFTGAACVASGGCLTVGGDQAANSGAVAAQWALLAPAAAKRPALSRPAQVRPGGVSVSTIASTLPAPTQAFASATQVAVSALVAVALMLFITFPANLFNLTLQENYTEIRRWGRDLLRKAWPPARHRRRDGGDGEEAGRPPTSWPLFLLVVVGGAVLGSLNDPGFGFTLTSLCTLLATALAIGLGVSVNAAVAFAYHRRRYRSVPMALLALPAGLAVALMCVLVSRLTAFEPGYLYGVVAGVVIARDLPKHEKGHMAGLTTMSMLVVSAAAWLASAAINPAARAPGAAFPLILLDDFLGAAFVSGLVGSVISMLPLQFLPGWNLKEWRREVWAVVFVMALFMLIQVLLRGAVTHPGAPLVTTVALFVIFGVFSVAFREFFAQRRRHRRGEVTPHLRERVRQLLAPATTTTSETVPSEGEDAALRAAGSEAIGLSAGGAVAAEEI